MAERSGTSSGKVSRLVLGRSPVPFVVAAAIAIALGAAPAAVAAPTCSASGPGLSVRTGETRTLTISCTGTMEITTIDIVDGPDHATISPGVSRPQARDFAVTAAAGYVGPDSLTFRGHDSSGWSDPAPATLEIRDAAFNTRPSCSVAPPAPTGVPGATIAVLLRCTDPDGDAYELVPSAPTFGSVAVDPVPASETDDGLRALRYTASRFLIGQDRFDVMAHDDHGAYSWPTEVIVTIVDPFPLTFPRPTPPPTSSPGGSYQDVQPPAAAGTATASLRLGKPPRLRTALRRGLRLAVRAPRAGTARVRITVDGRTAKRLRLSKRAKAVTVAKATGKVEAGRTRTLRARFTKRARRALGRSRNVRVTVRVTVGKDRAVTRTIALKR